MQLEDYFEFETTLIEPFGQVETIRFKGTRIGLEFIVNPFLQGESPERIYHGYRHTLSLEQVYGAIMYYLHNKPRTEAYLQQGRKIEDHNYHEHTRKTPSPVEQRLRELKAARNAA